MLKEFRVSNFKGFRGQFDFDLSKSNGYEFNPECIKNGIINNAIIYGRNGVGKSNLALAIFDIIEHITDKNRDESHYQHYSNAYNTTKVVEFYYSFVINGKSVVYEYKKNDYKTLIFECFSIDGEKIVLFDRGAGNNTFTTKLHGTESLNKLINDPYLSVLKYIKSNSSLPDNDINKTFLLFLEFIEAMLFFRSLENRIYLGYDLGPKVLDADIIERGNHQDLERFLNEAGVECQLTVSEQAGKKALTFDFNGIQIPYHEIASTGTLSLVLFYFWFQRVKDDNISFVLIDEFDAFYHHELSALIVNELKKTGVQFILTTHNSSIMTNDLLRPDCYFIMTKDKIKSLPNSTEKELREAHNIEKMYKAGAFNVK